MFFLEIKHNTHFYIKLCFNKNEIYYFVFK
jgi:hypothetical protein